MNDFDWQNDPAVVVPDCDPVAVYRSGNRLMIRQPGGEFEGEDDIVIIHIRAVPAVLEAIRKAVADAK